MSDIRYPEISLFIAGEFVPATGSGDLVVRNPATGEEIAPLPHASAADLDAALEAAGRTFGEWRQVSPYDRSKILRRAADLIRERADKIATIQTLEQGKTFMESRLEVLAAADIIDWFAEEGRRAYGRLIPSRGGDIRFSVIQEPVGPVAAFSPWNFPSVIPARKIAGSLAAGCTCIIKPAEETPATCLELARALADAGLPKGVLNVVTGVPAEISRHLIASDIIRKVSFTGSTAVGKEIGALAAKGVKRVTLELGGHAPVLVFDDADIDSAVAQSVAFKYRNAGQVCISPTRFLVQQKIHDRFVEKFAATAGALKIGDGLDPESQMGPMANERRISAMERLTADATKNGAQLAAGGERIGNRGFFWRPTVLSNVPLEAAAMNEEPFGPMILTRPFADFDEAIAEANRLPYGLAAYAFTSSARTAAKLAEGVETGMLGINNFLINLPETPFGGVKQSGYGSEGGIEGLTAYMQTKFVSQS